MKNTLLVQLLQTFSGKELKRWGKFIKSDYHISNKKTKALGVSLFEHSAKWQTGKLSKQELWKAIFPSTRYDEPSINNYLSDLLEKTYEFIAIEEQQNQPGKRYDLILSGLFRRGRYQHTQRIVKKWDKQQQKSLQQGPQELLYQHEIAVYQDKLNLLESKRRYAASLQQKSDYLDQFYLLQQLMYYCEMLNRGKIIQGDYQLTYLDDLLKRYEAQQVFFDSAAPAIGIYVNLIGLLKNGDQQYLLAIESQLQLNAQALSEEELRTVYDFLFNFCIQQINSGKPAYYQKVFELYQGLIQQDLLVRKGRISQWTYTNIITTASRLGAWQWADDFLNSHRIYLPPEDEYNAYHYNQAALHYEQRQFDAALSLLHEVDFVDAFYYQAAKTIQLKIYYLLGEYEAADALIAAARQFINRNRQISSSKKQSYLHFLQLINLLFKVKMNQKIWRYDKWQKHSNRLKQKLADKNYPANHKDWLKEMMKGLAYT